jgi:hypothetical protein
MQRGPKSAESQVTYLVPEAIPQRPEPPDYLSAAQKKQWNLYVERMPVDWFTAEVQPLLVNLCRAVCLSDYFAARLGEVTTDLEGLEARLRQENPEITDGTCRRRSMRGRAAWSNIPACSSTSLSKLVPFRRNCA